MYEQSISRKRPGCIVFLLDRSDSMSRPWGGSRETLAQGAARAINSNGRMHSPPSASARNASR